MSATKIFCFLIFIFVAHILLKPNLNNSCDNYLSYLNILFSKNCYHIPDFYKDPAEIIRRHIGVCETHQVTTEDGYILSLFRIPRKNAKGVILLQHCMFHDSRIWVAQYNQSNAFLFWRAGYDVWLGNQRGTLYSKKHVNLTVEDPKFWDYSLQEMGYYDNHATVNYIKMATNVTKIIYLGYSLGGTTGIIYATTRSEEALKSLKMVIPIAPVSYIKHVTSMMKNWGFILDFIQYFSYTLTRYDSWALSLLRTFSSIFPFKKSLALSFSLIFGWNPDEFDPNYVNLFTIQSGSEISIKPARHLHQMYSSGGNFQMYDYGVEKNIRIYKSEKPLPYQVEEIKVPVLIISGNKDTLSHPKDNEILYNRLNEKIRRKLDVEDVNHIDFLFGRHRVERIFSRVLELLKTLD